MNILVMISNKPFLSISTNFLITYEYQMIRLKSNKRHIMIYQVNLWHSPFPNKIEIPPTKSPSTKYSIQRFSQPPTNCIWNEWPKTQTQTELVLLIEGTIEELRTLATGPGVVDWLRESPQAVGHMTIFTGHSLDLLTQEVSHLISQVDDAFKITK